MPRDEDKADVSSYLIILYIYITFLAVLFEYIANKNIMYAKRLCVLKQRDCYPAYIFSFLYFILLFFLMVTENIFKHDAIESGTGFYLSLLTVLSILAITFGVFSNGRLAKFLVLVVALTSLLSGTRTPLAFLMFVLALNYIWLRNIGFYELISTKKSLLVGLVIGVGFVYISKYFYTYFNIYGVDGFYKLANDFMASEYCHACGFEPVLQLSIFDLVLNNLSRFEDIDASEIFTTWLAITPVPLSVLDSSTAYVSEMVRFRLIPDAGYSIAGNVLTESLIIAGLIGPYVFLFFWFLLVFFLDVAIKKTVSCKNKMYFVLILVVLVYVCFFWNRYMVGSALGHIRNFILFYALFLFLYGFVKRLGVKNGR